VLISFWILNNSYIIAKPNYIKLLEPILISFQIMGYFKVVRPKLFAKFNIELILISFDNIIQPGRKSQDTKNS
jgi:hypothetical protein